jgi:predicted phosphohydrolase
MAIYAIGDLHLSGDPPTKPMEVFGAQWSNHRQKIIENWERTISTEDTVILCGDTSWSMNLNDAITKDLDMLSRLPGNKVILKGNHDYWWSSAAKLTAALQDRFHFLHNNCYLAGTIAICGTRGWNLPSMSDFTEHDAKLYHRECQRLEISLQEAAKAQSSRIIVAMHYPPLYQPEEITGFTELCRSYHVSDCVYGHVHGDAAHFLNLFQGKRDGTQYRLVASDYINFCPVRIV